METESTLAQGLLAADVRARYDAACKRLLSEKIILAWIMKSCLEEYRDCTVQEIAGNYDLLSLVMIGLGGKDDDNYAGVLKLLDVLLFRGYRRRGKEADFTRRL